MKTQISGNTLVTSSMQIGEIIGLAACLVLLAVVPASFASIPNPPPQLLYDVNFEAPTHIVDRVATTDLGPVPRHGPSSNYFGQPMIRTQAGTLDGQFVRFDKAHSTTDTYPYCQMRFSLNSTTGIAQYPSYRMRFDMVVHSLETSNHSDEFTAFIDDANIQPIRFHPNHQIEAANAGVVGTYTDNSRLAFRIDVDQVQRSWKVFMNDMQLVSGPLITLPDYGTEMASMRFNLAAYSTYASVDVDNVRIEGLPEPVTFGLFAAAWMLSRRARARE